MGKRLRLTTVICIAMMPIAAKAEGPVVKLETVTAANDTLRRVFYGRVVARETVDLSFQVAGQILEFPIEEGAFVPAGDLVAMLDLEPFELALEQANAQYDQAERQADRYRQLVGSAVAESNLQDAETQLELSGIAVRNAERALDQATLHAPFNAIVAGRLLPNFSTASAGTPVVRLHDMSDVRIEIDVPETLFQRAGRDPNLMLIADFPSGDRSYRMDVREFNAETAQVAQTYSITLGMEPQDDLDVLPGSSAKVTAYLSTGAVRIEIPASAVIVANDSSTHVMVFDPTGANEGIVTNTPVEIAPTDRGMVEVISGLEEGQEIVLIGASALQDGEAVRRFVGFGD